MTTVVDRATLQRVIKQANLDTSQADASEPSVPGQATPTTMSRLIKLVMNDVHHYWRAVFAKSRINYRPPNYETLHAGDDPERSKCFPRPRPAQARRAFPDLGPFYCSAGGEVRDRGTISTPIIYFGVPWLYNTMSRVNPDNFDFAVASVVAHEFGHHIQELLLEAGDITVAKLPGKYKELSADCLGGVWAKAAYQAGELEDTDVEEAEHAAWNAGSDLPDDRSPDPHGTRRERVAAFKLGYINGRPIVCLRLRSP
jgi:predicted metalloprotease